MNKVVIAGNVTRDPEEKGSGNGPAVFSMAVNDRVKDKATGEFKDDPSFVDVTCWGHKFGPKDCKGVALGIAKGTYVVVVGRIKQERWEKEGEKRSKLTVVAESVSTPQGGASNGGSSAKQDDWGF